MHYYSQLNDLSVCIGYQLEIDSLSKKLKFCENSFLGVYHLLVEAPDPAPLLQSCLECYDQVKILVKERSENQRLRAALELSGHEVDQLRKDIETEKLLRRSQVTSLESQLQKLQQTQQSQSEYVNESTAFLALESKCKQLQEREQDLTWQLQRSQQEVRLLNTSNQGDQTTRAETSMTSGHSSAEWEMLEQETRRLSDRCVTMESENLEMQKKLSNLDMVVKPKDDLQQSLDSNKAERTVLKKELEEQKLQLRAKEADFETLMITVKDQETISKARTKELVDLLSTRSDYNEMKDEMIALKSVMFSGLTPSQLATESTSTLALLNNKRLEDENTKLRADFSELTDEIKQLRESTAEMTKQHESQSKLISQLESQLLGPNGAKKTVRQSESLSRKSQFNTSLDDLLCSAGEITQENSPTYSSVSDVITAQRDRFHQKNQELLAETRQQRETLISKQRDVDSLQKDNVKLYEKIKFLESYRGQSTESVLQMPDYSNSSSSASVGRRGDDRATLNKYNDQYEQKLDPFQQFHKKEYGRKVSAMSPIDRAALSVSKVLVYNSSLRVFLFGYIVVLHLLVFGTLMQFARYEECRHEHDLNFWRERISSTQAVSDDERSELSAIKQLLEQRIPKADDALKKNA